MQRRLWFFIPLATMLTLSPSVNASAAGQSTYGQTTARGEVADGSGAPIANASVVLEDTNHQVVARATTDETGQYEIKIPVSGTYSLTVAATTFSTLVFENLHFPNDPATLPDATLRPGTAIYTVNVNVIVGLAGGQIARVGRVGILGDVLLEDVPFSVQSYTSTFLENQQALSLTDVLESDAAFATQAAPSKASQLFDVFLVRGFREDIDGPAAINGLFGLFGGRPNMEFVERVDVFHGPSAFLMGAPDSVGGVVNMAPKRAKDAPLLILEPTYLGKTVYGGHVDASDRIGPHKAFGGRVNGMYRDGEGAIRDSRLLNGGAAADLDYRSKLVLLSLDAQYLRDYNQGNQYVVIPGPGVTLLPPAMPNDLSTEPVWMFASFNQKLILGRADVNFSRAWTLTAASGFSHGSGGAPTYCPIILLDNSGTVLCEQISEARIQENSSSDVGMRGKFNTGHLAHSLAAGWNRVQQTGSYAERYDAGLSQPYNLYKRYRPASPNFVPPPKQPTDYLIDVQSTSGWYLGDTVGTLRGRLLLTGGFRYSTVGLNDTFRDNTSPHLYTESAFSPSITGLFQLAAHVSLYGNFIQALEPGAIAPPDTRNAGQIFPPAISNQMEGGAKAHFNTWTGTVAFYRISRAYGTESTATNPPTFTQNGRQVNQGIEVNFAGDIIPSLQAIVSASFIHSRQRATGDPTTEGKSVASIAGASERLDVIWAIPHLRNSALICNLMETGSAPYDDTNSFRVSAWTRLDLGARYSFGHEKPLILRTQVENILNSKFWASAFSGGLAVAGPRAINLSISKAF
jgi:iron complex outermembrane receptor protein